MINQTYITMNRNNFINYLSSVAPVQAHELEMIVNSFSLFRLHKGEFFLEIGKVSDQYLFLETGLLRAYLHDTDGNEVTTEFFTEKNVAFEVTSFFHRKPSQVHIQAITDCTAFSIRFHELNTLFHERPAFRELGRAILVKEFTATKLRNYHMISQSADERYQHLLSTKPEIIMHAPLKQIASYLGITDSTLSRLRNK